MNSKFLNQQIAMTKPLILLSIFLLSRVIENGAADSNGLSVKPIHPHSSESPFYQSKASHPTMQTPIDTQEFLYTVKIGIGSFKSDPPYKEYYLIMDTGSSLVWLQCDGCTKCFPQSTKPFPKQNSTSFRPILVQNNYTYYNIEYGGGSSTKGMLARETFHLISNTGKLFKLENVKFGCGLQNDMLYARFKNNKIAGIMGLGWEDNSLLKQISPSYKVMFSYCLPVISDKTRSTLLRFGQDVVHHKNPKTTPLYTRNGTSHYYVDLLGISINSTRLKIKPEVFAYNERTNKGGCMIDSGTPISRVISPAFDILKLELDKYLSRSTRLEKVPGLSNMELCYKRSKRWGSYKKLPGVTFHLRGSRADFVMDGEAVFDVFGRRREYFCLAMARYDGISIIGSHQQTNHKIIYDTKNKKLVFHPQDCSKNP